MNGADLKICQVITKKNCVDAVGRIRRDKCPRAELRFSCKRFISGPLRHYSRQRLSVLQVDCCQTLGWASHESRETEITERILE